jgi:signal peptidase I
LRTAANLVWQVAVLAVIAFAVVGLRPGEVSGYSMEPRIDTGELVLINALAYRLGAPRRGDIVAFRHLRTGPSVYLKRVVGLPGDRVAIERGTVRVNGAKLEEPYVRFADDRTFGAVTVPPNAYYVLGDNRPASEDSRTWGFVPASELIGHAAFGLWPPGRIGALR